MNLQVLSIFIDGCDPFQFGLYNTLGDRTYNVTSSCFHFYDSQIFFLPLMCPKHSNSHVQWVEHTSWTSVCLFYHKCNGETGASYNIRNIIGCATVPLSGSSLKTMKMLLIKFQKIQKAAHLFDLRQLMLRFITASLRFCQFILWNRNKSKSTTKWILRITVSCSVSFGRQIVWTSFTEDLRTF